MKQHIYLIGFMGTGKTTISHKLQEMTGAKEVDMDAWIVEKNDMTINDMFDKFGETYFRDRETDAVREIAGTAPAIVSCGGGAVLRQENTQMMKNGGRIVLLTATPETVYERVKNSTDRPLLNGHMNVEYIASMMEKRRELYAGACDISVATDGKTPSQIAEEILKATSEV
ncbi:shikimate kinase [uncultured Eubacterium sp.]|uniref:shikimate kinase n=1 Tax=uncultured Eubacterium sp. TaxID=165185 RepID=UPI0025CCB853|nr:shikimate kinase [uncultured Eubacterium sp.]MCI6537649.1 shikimate kinase [Lachnospiraceae bacterium]